MIDHRHIDDYAPICRESEGNRMDTETKQRSSIASRPWQAIVVDRRYRLGKEVRGTTPAKYPATALRAEPHHCVANEDIEGTP